MTKINELPVTLIATLNYPHRTGDYANSKATHAAKVIDALGNRDGNVSLCEINQASANVIASVKKKDIAPVARLLNSSPTEVAKVACQFPQRPVSMAFPSAPLAARNALYDANEMNLVWKNGLGHSDSLIPANVNYANLSLLRDKSGLELSIVKQIYELRNFVKAELHKVQNQDTCQPAKLTEHQCRVLLQNTRQLLGDFEIQPAQLQEPSPYVGFELHKSPKLSVSLDCLLPTQREESKVYVTRTLTAQGQDPSLEKFVDHKAYVNVPVMDGTLREANLEIKHVGKVMYRVITNGMPGAWAISDRSASSSNDAVTVKIPVGMGSANGVGVSGVKVPNGQVEIVALDFYNKPKEHVLVPFGQPNLAAATDNAGWVPNLVDYVAHAQAKVDKLWTKRHALETV